MIPAHPSELNDARLDATYGPGFATFVRLALGVPAEQVLEAWCETAERPCPRMAGVQTAGVQTAGAQTKGTKATGSTGVSTSAPASSLAATTSI